MTATIQYYILQKLFRKISEEIALNGYYRIELFCITLLFSGLVL